MVWSTSEPDHRYLRLSNIVRRRCDKNRGTKTADAPFGGNRPVGGELRMIPLGPGAVSREGLMNMNEVAIRDALTLLPLPRTFNPVR